MNRRTILALVAGFIIFSLIAALLWPKQDSQLFISDAFASNIQFPRIEENSVKYFTGFGFAEYDLNTHKTKTLTPVYALPDVTNVKWGANGALFKASGYSAVDQLEPQLSQRGLALDVEYWWLVNFEIGTISLVGNPDTEHNITDVVWLEDSKQYMYIQFHEDTSQELYRADVNVAPVLVGTLKSASTLLWANQSSLITAQPNGETISIDRVQLPALSSAQIIDRIPTRVAASPDGQYIAYSQRETTSGGEDESLEELYIYDVGKNKNTLVGSGIGAPPVWSTKTSTLTVPLQEEEDTGLKIATIIAENAKSQKFIINDTIVKPRFVTKVGDPKRKRYLIIDANNFAFMVDETKKAFAALPKADKTFLGNEKTIYEQGFYIAYFPNTNQYNIYITDNPYKANVQKALEYIKNHGTDPNQLFIKWYPDDDVNPST